MRKTKNFNFVVGRSRTRSPRSPVVEEKVLDDGRWERVSPHPPSYHYCINYLATEFQQPIPACKKGTPAWKVMVYFYVETTSLNITHINKQESDDDSNL